MEHICFRGLDLSPSQLLQLYISSYMYIFIYIERLKYFFPSNILPPFSFSAEQAKAL